MMFPSDDEPFEDEEELEEIRREAERRRQAQQRTQPQQPTRRAAAQRALAGQMPAFPGFTGGLGNLMQQAAMNAGFQMGGMAMGGRASAAMFRQDFEAYSTALYEASEGRMDRINGGRQNLMFGGNILMPPEALDLLSASALLTGANPVDGSAARLDIESPWTFELINPQDRERHTHAGVLEFTAQAGRVYLPQWMMEQLGFQEGSRVRIMGASLPKGKFVKLQPQDLVFLELSDHKAVLERALSLFPCLSVGDIIEISHQHINLRFLVMEAKAQDGSEGTAINILNTDIEVDFAPPVGYKEPVREPPKPLPTMAEKFGINVEQTEEQPAAAGFDAFMGQGNSLGGKRIKGKGTKSRKIEKLDPESRVRRTDQQTFINANAMADDTAAPAALNLPYGHLFFGYPLVPRPNGAATELGETEEPGPMPAFQGQGATLSGRMRPSQEAAASSTPGKLKNEKKSDAFKGPGNSLGKKREVIEID